MAWIELHQSLLKHPKLIRLAAQLGVKKQQAFWNIVTLWFWALDYADSGDLSAFGPHEIAAAAEWNGDPNLFVTQLQECRWLDGMQLHDWMDYAGRLVEKRDANKRRMREKRTTHVQRTTNARSTHVQGLPNQPNQPNQPEEVPTPDGVDSPGVNEGRKKKTYAEDSDPYMAAKYLEHFVLSWAPETKVTEAKLQGWADEAEKMNRIDGMPWDEFRELVRWIDAQKPARNGFAWNRTIRSMGSIREKRNEGKFSEFREHLAAMVGI